ncbi:28S ribosomal protein S33, mitochondrial-like [Patiria miniata]|uniref:Small ribosomal subunit protein mS33 n=1 Tax=Patiria miniata TaxID=46514 RepID=A0A914BAW9_PATMI|nr:28S ribosomal protein S33, mitochondrial-like [Patiria miniata]XP_038073471.1 28S ribosomal protein S33, mitochondrial-like [Patiria miniata]XP_038073509.1 28S ribosomal protein S33, mitochondrial-like [Patiria miniata]
MVKTFTFHIFSTAGESSCIKGYDLREALQDLGMSSLYARRMARLSARIFGDVFRPTTSQSMKVVQLMREKPREHKPEVTEYYPPHTEVYKMMRRLQFVGLYRDEHADFRAEMRRVARLKGKAPPKKGEGKRAMKRK